jgi:hypothetical protein
VFLTVKFVVLILLFLVSPVLFAAGQRDDPVHRAHDLVAEGQINEAILLLEEAIRYDPDRFLEAERLLRRIRSIRDAYTLLFEQLIENLTYNPDQLARTLAIIDAMEALDQFPNPRVAAQIRDARIIAQLAFDRYRIEEMMNAALVLVEDGRYIDALEQYTSLRRLQEQTFQERGYSEDFLERTEQAIAGVLPIVERAAEALPRLFAASDTLQQKLQENPRHVLTDDELLPLLSHSEVVAELVLDHWAIARAVAELQGIRILQFSDVPIEWYLTFHEIANHGREGYRNREGIQFALERAYWSGLEQVIALIEDQGLEEWDSAFAAIDRRDYPRAGTLFLRLAERSVPLRRIAEELHVLDQRVGLPPGEPLSLAALVMQESAAILGATMDIIDSNRLLTDTRIPALQLVQQQLEEDSRVVAALIEQERLWRERVSVRDTRVSTSSAQLVGDVEQFWHEALTERIAQIQRTAITRSRLQADPLIPEIPLLAQRISGIEQLLYGVEEELESHSDDQQDRAFRVVRFPDTALAESEEIAASIARALDLLQAVQTEITELPTYVQEFGGIEEERQRLGVMEIQFRNLVARIEIAQERGQFLISEAATLREEGLAAIAAARRAILIDDYDQGRAQWDTAREVFFQSLEFREDSEFREEADTLIRQVGRELQDLENRTVVRQVRELLTQAEREYTEDQYFTARDLLLQAQQLWERTNLTRNSEIERWLVLATAAISLSEGRDLSPSDPLFTVLSSYLSLAREDFQAGRALHRAGIFQSAEPLFERALQNIRNVRDVRPLNWDARIMELEIARERDADNFDTVFATRYQEALDRLPREGPLVVYGELEVLAEIQPDFPGIQEQLRRLEIQLNLRPDPVDQQRAARARELYQQAQELARGNSRDQAQVAVSLLEEALTINPQDGDARFMMDQLRIRLGGEATVALASVEEQQFRRAATLFSQGQVLQALGIVERLLTQEENRNYPPLVDLRRRIGLRLGI